MKAKSFAMLCTAAVVCALCGCETITVPPETSGTTYVEPGEPVLGKPDDITMYDLESAARQLMSKMLANDEFRRKYGATRKKKGIRPVVIVGGIRNLLDGVRIKERLDMIRDSVIRSSLTDSGLFTVKKTSAEKSPDYMVTGDFRGEADTGGFYSQYLRLEIQDVENDEIIWEGTQKVVKH